MTETSPTPLSEPIEQPITACGSQVKDPAQYPSAQFHGKTVLFCTEACRLAFLNDPERFMAGEIEHPE